MANKNTIIALRESGAAITAIAQKVGHSVSYVYGVLRSHAPHLLGSRHHFEKIQDAIVADFRAGLLYSQIANKYGISVYFVQKILQQHIPHLKRSAPKRICTLSKKIQKRRAMVLKLHRKGLPCTQIAEMLKMNVSTIRNDVHELKEPSYRYPSKVNRNKAIIKNRCDGKTVRAIAKQFGISRSRVSQILIRHAKKSKK